MLATQAQRQEAAWHRARELSQAAAQLETLREEEHTQRALQSLHAQLRAQGVSVGKLRRLLGRPSSERAAAEQLRLALRTLGLRISMPLLRMDLTDLGGHT